MNRVLRYVAELWFDVTRPPHFLYGGRRIKAEARVAAALDHVGLTGHVNQRPGELSGGDGTLNLTFTPAAGRPALTRRGRLWAGTKGSLRAFSTRLGTRSAAASSLRNGRGFRRDLPPDPKPLPLSSCSIVDRCPRCSSEGISPRR